MRILLSKIMLKKNFYKHHILGLILNGIGFIILTLINIYRIHFDYQKPIETWIFFLFMLPRFILYPLEDVLNKILLMNKFTLPHSLMFMRGIYVFFMTLISFIILHFTGKINYESLIIIFSNKQRVAITFIRIFLQFLRGFIIMKIIYIFTPQHITFLPIFDVIIDIIYKLFVARTNSFDFIFLFVCISSFIIIVGALIFNEIIVINKYGLEEGTTEGLLNKEKIDNLATLGLLNDTTFDGNETYNPTEVNNIVDDTNNNTTLTDND